MLIWFQIKSNFHMQRLDKIVKRAKLEYIDEPAITYTHCYV